MRRKPRNDKDIAGADLSKEPKDPSQQDNEDETASVKTIDAFSPTDEPPRMRLHVSLFEYGKQRALDTGATEVRKEDIEAIEKHAEAMARESWLPPYDPEKNVGDRLREEEYRRTSEERLEIEKLKCFATARVREDEESLASTLAAREKPSLPLGLCAASFALIAGSIAPTAHDFLAAGISDELFAWMVAIAIGGSGAGTVVWATISSLDDEGEGGRVYRVATGGAILAAGFGLLRIGLSQGFVESLFAVALTVIEVAAVFLLDAAARRLRPRVAEWKKQRVAHEIARGKRDSAVLDLGGLERKHAVLSAKIGAHVRYVGERTQRNETVEQTVVAATCAVIDGYHAGVAMNRGRLAGARRKS